MLTHRGSHSSQAYNIEAKSLKFCDKQRGLALLLVTKFQAFRFNTAGLRAGESLLLGTPNAAEIDIGFPFTISTPK